MTGAKAVVGFFLLVHGCSLAKQEKHEYFNTYEECDIAGDAFVNANDGWKNYPFSYISATYYCLSNPDWRSEDVR